MGPRRQSKRGRLHAKPDPDAADVGDDVSKRRRTAPKTEATSEGAEATNESLPPVGNVRTTRSLKGEKSELKTPEASKEPKQEPLSESELVSEGGGADEGELGGEDANGDELTEYERERRERMAENEAMLLALGVQDAAQGLGGSAQVKRARATAKGLQTVRAKKEKTEPVAVRRSSRIQHVPPESLGIDKENRDGSVVLFGEEAPFQRAKSEMAAPWEEKRRIQGPIKFESSNSDDHSSDAAFLDALKRLRDDQPLKHRAIESKVDPKKLKLREGDVARVVKDRIFAVAFFPTTEKVIVAAGDKSGGLGIWDVDAKDDNDGFHVLSIGPRPVSALAVSKHDCTKLYTCSFDGSLRVLDVEKGVFAEAYVDESADLSAMCLEPTGGGHVAYVGDGQGNLTVVDLRAGESRVTYGMHERKINSIDFNLHHPNMFVTGGTDATAHIWDVRKLPGNETQKVIHPLATLPHVKAVNSIYFAPDGEKLVSTSYDNYIRVYDNMLELFDSGDPKVTPPQPSMISHYNNTGRWISSFRAVWTWDSRHVAIGSMNRAIDVINVEDKQFTRLASEHMPTIPARNAVHPLMPIIAGGVSGGKLHIWR